MSAQPLEIIIKGNSSQANTALQKTQQELVKTSVAAQKADSSLQKLSKDAGQSMFNLTEKIKSLQSAVFTEKDRGKIALYNAEIKKTEIELAKLNAIGTATGNGIAQGAGKAFSAVRNLAYILPGVGIAGIIGFAVEPIAKFISYIFGATEAVKQLNERRAAFNEDTATNYGKEITSLQFLREAIENTSIPMAKRLQAIKDLKKEFPGLFDGLTNEQLLNGKVAASYNLAAAAILRKAKATAAITQLEKIAAEKLKVLEKNQKDLAETNERLRTAQANPDQDAEGRGTETVAMVRANIIEIYNIRKNAAQQEIDRLNKEQAFYLDIAVKGADRVIEVEKAKIDKIIKQREDAFKKPQLYTIQGLDGNFDKTPLSRGTGSTIEPNIIVKPKITFIEDPEQSRKILDGINKMILNAEIQKGIDEAISTMINDTISSTAEAVADALSGGQDVVPRLFDNIIKGIGQQIKELGKYLVKIGIEKLAIDKAIKALGLNPAATIAVGFAAQILGSLLIASAQKKSNSLGQGFASGTTGVREGGFYNVGERGPERIFLPTGTKVQPNNEVQAYGGGNQVFIPAVTLSGPDLVIAFNRASQMMGRNG